MIRKRLPSEQPPPKIFPTATRKPPSKRKFVPPRPSTDSSNASEDDKATEQLLGLGRPPSKSTSNSVAQVKTESPEPEPEPPVIEDDGSEVDQLEEDDDQLEEDDGGDIVEDEVGVVGDEESDSEDDVGIINAFLPGASTQKFVQQHQERLRNLRSGRR